MSTSMNMNKPNFLLEVPHMRQNISTYLIIYYVNAHILWEPVTFPSTQ